MDGYDIHIDYVILARFWAYKSTKIKAIFMFIVFYFKRPISYRPNDEEVLEYTTLDLY